MCKSDRLRKFTKHFSKQGGDAKWQVSEADGVFLKGETVRFTSALMRLCSLRVYVNGIKEQLALFSGFL